jgi:phosphotransferase system enzyme I (PtsI)
MKMTDKKSGKTESVFDALCVSPGMAMGPAFHFRKMAFELDDLNYNVSDIDHEIHVFKNACQATIDQLRETQSLSQHLYGEEFVEIFESQIVFLEDQILLAEIEEMIRTEVCSAAYAVFNVFHAKREHFLNLENEYFRDRAIDLLDLKQKLLHTIFGVGTEYQLTVPSVVFAESLSPSDTVHFNRNLILGFVTDTGGRTSHVSIIAQSMQVPYMINDHHLARNCPSGETVILDGYDKKIIFNPSKKTVAGFHTRKKQKAEIRDHLISESALPTETVDKIAVEVHANVEFLQEVKKVKEFNAAGIGLFRTEGIFLEKASLPEEEEQYQIYRKFSVAMKEQPIILRTVDVGGDKLVKNVGAEDEMNPFLGWRAIRFCIDEPDIFKMQLRAILRANVNGNIKIMLPMVSCVEEIRITRKLIEESQEELAAAGTKYYPNPSIGVMIETPSAALMSDVLLEEVDFASIGSNDLTQYTLAVDRTNMKIARLFNDLHPAVLRLMKTTIDNGNKLGKEISLCGEMAGNPLALPVLLGLGFRKLSVSPYLIPKVKKIIRSLEITDCRALVGEVVLLGTAREVENQCRKFLKNKLPELQNYI